MQGEGKGETAWIGKQCIPINLSGEEALKLKESADSLKKIMETIEL